MHNHKPLWKLLKHHNQRGLFCSNHRQNWGSSEVWRRCLLSVWLQWIPGVTMMATWYWCQWPALLRYAASDHHVWLGSSPRPSPTPSWSTCLWSLDLVPSLYSSVLLWLLMSTKMDRNKKNRAVFWVAHWRSQNHRTLGHGGGLKRSSSPSPLQEQDHLECVTCFWDMRLRAGHLVPTNGLLNVSYKSPM